MRSAGYVPTKEEFSKWPRNKKRSLIVSVGNRNMRVFDYIKQVAKGLPICREKTSKKNIEHEKVMRDLYMQGGLVAIQEYQQMIADVFVDAVKDVKKNAKKDSKKANDSK